MVVQVGMLNSVTALNSYLAALHMLTVGASSNQKKRELWLNMYKDFHMNNSIALAMILIHPDFPDVRQSKRSGFVKQREEKCELGKLISGAICPNKAEERDHIWPYSLGGITEDRNRADLCRACNRGKSNTVVAYFPWGDETPSWVIEKIESTRRRIGN